MEENKNVRVYLITATDRKNYITATTPHHISFGPKEDAAHFTPKQAETLQRVLINNVGNGHIESD